MSSVKNAATNMWPTVGRMETNSNRYIPQETSTTDVAHFRYGSRICR